MVRVEKRGLQLIRICLLPYARCLILVATLTGRLLSLHILYFSDSSYGACGGTRTLDTRLKRAVLFHLSYASRKNGADFALIIPTGGLVRLCSRLVPRSIVGAPVACGSRDIRDIVSACTVWFTFVFRTPTPRAVEDFVIKVLRDSRGSCHSASALHPSFVPLLYHNLGGLSRGFLHFFIEVWRRLWLCSPSRFGRVYFMPSLSP